MNKEYENLVLGCQNCHQSFLIESDDFSFYQKIKVPPPTFCPECRLKRRLIWRNEGNFRAQKCDLCDKKIITNNSSFNKFPTYCYDCWHSDKWDGLSYGQDYDFAKAFFEQWKELLDKTPNINLWGLGNINSEYSNYTGYSKNIYLSNATYCEDVSYSRLVDKSKNLVDCYYVSNSEFCYENFVTRKIYNSSFLNNCNDCLDSYFLFDCRNCSHCFMSSNLRNKSFYIRNKQYSKEDYFKEIEKYNLSSYRSIEKFRNEFLDLIKSQIHRFANIINSHDSTGDNIFNSKNVKYSFMVEGENLKYCWRMFSGSLDCYDLSGGLKNELCYESSLAADGGYLTKFFSHSRGNKETEYIHLCLNCSNCFGCIGLKNKQYCILNKQYTKEEYNELVPKIIKHMLEVPYISKVKSYKVHKVESEENKEEENREIVYRYGEFFPPELSPFAYNETIAQEYYPKTKEQALSQGYRWKDKEERNYTIEIKNEDIPDNIDDTDESIINKVIECQNKGNESTQCTEAFKIIEPEYQFYRRMKLPLPRLCPNCRHYQRLKQRNPLKLWHRKCMKEGCQNEFETSYAPERPEIVYCEQCYQKEIY